MKTIYDLTLEEYRYLLPLVKNDAFYNNVILKDSTIIVNLNEATYIDLQKIKGLGEKRAKTVVEYRNKLGGFYSLNQLKEIPRFPKKNYTKITKQLYVDKAVVRKIKVNTFDFQQLIYHPYVDTVLAENLLSYLESNPKIKNLNTLKLIDGFNDQRIKKISPYLSFD